MMRAPLPDFNSVVIPGLGPGIPEFGSPGKKLRDARAKPGHDDRKEGEGL